MLGMTPEQVSLVEGEFAKIIQEIKCPICLELLKTPRTGPCQHNFCEECIYEYIKDNHSECPTCRQPGVNKRSLHKNLALNNLLGPLTIICEVWGITTGSESRAVQEKDNVKEEAEEEVQVHKKRRRGGADTGEAAAPPMPARGKARSRGRGGARANSRRPRGRAAGNANVVEHEEEEHAVEGAAAGAGGSWSPEVPPVQPVQDGHSTGPHASAAPHRPFQSSRRAGAGGASQGGEAHAEAPDEAHPLPAADAPRNRDAGEAAGNETGGLALGNREGPAHGGHPGAEGGAGVPRKRARSGGIVASQDESVRRRHDDDDDDETARGVGEGGQGERAGERDLGARSFAEAESMYVVDFGSQSLQIPSIPQTYDDNDALGSVYLHAGAHSARQLNAGAMESLLAARVEAGGVGERRGSVSSTTTRGSTHGVEPAQGGSAMSKRGREVEARLSSAEISPLGGGGAWGGGGGIGAKVVTPPGGDREVEEMVSGARTVVQKGGQATKRKERKFDFTETLPQAEDVEDDQEEEEEVQGGANERMPSPRRLSLGGASAVHGVPTKSSSFARKDTSSCQLCPGEPIVITTTGFEMPEKGILLNMATSMGATVKETWDSTVTHVVCHTDASGAASTRTLKYCLGLLSGARLVKAEWLRECKRTGQAATPCDDFEVSGCMCLMRNTDTGVKSHELHKLPSFEERRRQALGGDAALLSPARIGGKRFYLHGTQFEGFGSSRADLLQLLRLAGGIFKDTAPRNQDLRYAIVLCSDASQKERVKAWRAGGADVLETGFVMDSVTTFDVVKDWRSYDVK